MRDNAKCTSCPKVVTDESVNTICALLNEDCRLTLRGLETIMNDYLGDALSQITQFYQSSKEKLVLRYDKGLNLFGDCVEK